MRFKPKLQKLKEINMQRYDLRKNGTSIAVMKASNAKSAGSFWVRQKKLEDFYLTSTGAYWKNDAGDYFEIIPQNLW